MRVIGGWLGQWTGQWLGADSATPPGALSGSGSAAWHITAVGNLQAAPSASMSGAVYIRISAALLVEANPRVLVESQQSRVWALEAECRIVPTAMQSRWVGVNAESRIMLTQTESRSLAIAMQSRVVKGED